MTINRAQALYYRREILRAIAAGVRKKEPPTDSDGRRDEYGVNILAGQLMALLAVLESAPADIYEKRCFETLRVAAQECLGVIFDAYAAFSEN